MVAGYEKDTKKQPGKTQTYIWSKRPSINRRIKPRLVKNWAVIIWRANRTNCPDAPRNRGTKRLAERTEIHQRT